MAMFVRVSTWQASRGKVLSFHRSHEAARKAQGRKVGEQILPVNAPIKPGEFVENYEAKAAEYANFYKSWNERNAEFNARFA